MIKTRLSKYLDVKNSLKVKLGLDQVLTKTRHEKFK